jgi:hypothetical protein
LDIQTPPTFKVSLKPSIIDDYKDLIKAKFDVGLSTSLQIYEEIGKIGYRGSYSTVRHHLSKLAKAPDGPLFMVRLKIIFEKGYRFFRIHGNTSIFLTDEVSGRC